MTNDEEIIAAATQYIHIYRGWMECEDTGAALNRAFNDLHKAVTGKTAIESVEEGDKK